MTDLVEFLRARLDEDERRARTAEEQWDDEDARYEWNDLPEASFAHARHHSPDRVLAEVEAKRTRIETYELAIARQRAEQDDYAAWCNNEPHGGSDALNGPDPKLIPGLEYALRCDALPYAEHPDYREEWKP